MPTNNDRLFVALSNEERFIASCESMGEADVRQKLNANRYDGRKAAWASDWLERVEIDKSDATRAEEKSSVLGLASKPNRHFASIVLGILFVLLLAGIVLFFQLR